ncbi:NAD(P)/FAD-dependent oxidoreductase [Desulfotomaculum copahuensis]|uniref:NAD(P)/FAD-dependent oxidoreductase n=1 Tax=Desulfotomaculum copahuensis TaxID=1838280 RepID=UPI001FA810BB|nr:FAD-dependent oxidoreductase [Desulfotomaculum copahuensis]
MIIGNSAAGVAAVETLRRPGGGASEITVVAGEPETAYSRCLLPDVLAGRRAEASIRLRPADFYRRLGVTLFSGVRAVELQPGEKKVLLKDGRELTYDRLLLATGAAAVRPELPGVRADGVFVLRTMADARALSAVARRVTAAVVAGGGLVGLKAALALKLAGVAGVTVVVASPRLLIRQLDERAAAMVEGELKEFGVQFIYNAGVKEFITGTGGRASGWRQDGGRFSPGEHLSGHGPDGGRELPAGCLSGVVLDDSRELPAGLAVVAKGVRPETELAARAGGRVGRGIKVDEYLCTSLPDVFAAGDCIEVTDRLTGQPVNSALWTLAFEQGRFAAANMLGQRRAYPAPLTRLNSARFGAVDVISVGRLDGPEVFTLDDPLSRTYRRLVFDGDRLAGFILAGRVDGAGVYTALVKSGRPVKQHIRALLGGRTGEVAVSGLMAR